MKIVDLSFIAGRNIYSHRPVMKMLLDLSDRNNFRTDMDPNFSRRLLQILPGLNDHHCSRRKPGGFVERLREGTFLGHVTEHVFLELQSLAGISTDYGKTFTGTGGLIEVICEYRCQEAAQILAPAALQIVSAILEGKKADVHQAVTTAKNVAGLYLPGPSTEAILAAAKKRQIPVWQLAAGTSLYRLGTGKYQKRIMASISELTGCVAVEVASSKPLTKKILSDQGLPVPKGDVACSVEEALIAARGLGFPLAMKPHNGNQGKGVSLHIKSEADVEKAFIEASAFSPSVVVEECLQGRHYRLLVINKELVAAAERIPAHIIGNGTQTISQLIEIENRNPLRGHDHEKPLTKISLDKIGLQVLRQQKLTIHDVPTLGQKVWLRDNANLSTGGIARDVTDEVHPLQAQMAVAAAKAVGLDIAGVDVVMQDISLSPCGQNGGIIEVNAAPGLRMHLHPAEGKTRDVGSKIVEMLFPVGTPTRVPVIAITGTNGKTTTTRMIDYVLRQHGQRSGMCCTGGIYCSGNQLRQGDLTGPTSAQAVLAMSEIDVAVLEVARGGIVQRGLGYERADVAVICNIRADHIGQDGIETMEDLVHVKSLVAEAVYQGGTVVLNADDPYVHHIAGRVWAEVIYTSMQSENITVRRHLGNGGRAVFVRRGTILASQGNRVTPVGRIRDFSVTFGGKATHQVENLLSAISACWGYGIPARQAGFYLRKFASKLTDNPGRANLYQINGFRVLVDYGHNPDGIMKIGRLAQKMKASRTIAVVGVPGDRCDELIVMAGEAAGRSFDLLLIKEDEDLRGRSPGETAILLQQGSRNAGVAHDRISIEANERLAVQKALRLARPGDLVVVFYEKLEAVLSEIDSARCDHTLMAENALVTAENIETSVHLF